MTTRPNIAPAGAERKCISASEIEAGTDYTCWPQAWNGGRTVDIWEANRKARAVMATLPDDVIEAICMIAPRRLKARGRWWLQEPQAATIH
jgi:hypothetical protein